MAMDITSYRRRMMMQCSYKRIPVSGTFELTPCCNFNCRMCYIHMEKEEYSGMGKELTAAEWIALGQEARKNGMLFLLLTGGEPLLRPDFKEIYDALFHMGLFLTINSNGSLWTPEFIEWIQKRPPLQVNVTLYGGSRETYGRLCGNARACELVKRNLLNMKAAGINVRLNVTVTKLNETDMSDIMMFACENGFPINGTSYMFPQNRIREAKAQSEEIRLSAEQAGKVRAKLLFSMTQEKDRAQIAERIEEECAVDYERQSSRRMNCSAGKSSFWVSWSGQMYPCGTIPYLSVDLKERDFFEAWKQTIRQTDEILLPSKCEGCAKRRQCVICGAAALAEGHGKTEQVSDYLCKMTDAYLKEVSKYRFEE